MQTCFSKYLQEWLHGFELVGLIGTRISFLTTMFRLDVVHPASFPVGTSGPFPEGKAAGV